MTLQELLEHEIHENAINTTGKDKYFHTYKCVRSFKGSIEMMSDKLRGCGFDYDIYRNTLNKLVKKGILEKIRSCADSRKYVYSITKKGEEL